MGWRAGRQPEPRDGVGSRQVLRPPGMGQVVALEQDFEFWAGTWAVGARAGAEEGAQNQGRSLGSVSWERKGNV